MEHAGIARDIAGARRQEAAALFAALFGGDQVRNQGIERRPGSPAQDAFGFRRIAAIARQIAGAFELRIAVDMVAPVQIDPREAARDEVFQRGRDTGGDDEIVRLRLLQARRRGRRAGGGCTGCTQ